MDPRLLILDPHSALLDLVRTLPPDLAKMKVDSTTSVQEGLARLSGEEYDAVLCSAESPDELSIIVRVRKKDPDVPIVLVIAEGNATLGPLGLQAGAHKVLERPSDPKVAGPLLGEALKTALLSRSMKAEIAQTKTGVRDLRALVRESHLLIRTARNSLRQTSGLLVEDDPESALLILRACAKAGLPPFEIVQDAEETVKGPPASFPMIVLDLHRASPSPLEVLEKIRKRPAFALIPVILISDFPDSEGVRRAYELGGNSCLTRPSEFEEWVDLVRALGIYWLNFNHGAAF